MTISLPIRGFSNVYLDSTRIEEVKYITPNVCLLKYRSALDREENYVISLSAHETIKLWTGTKSEMVELPL